MLHAELGVDIIIFSTIPLKIAHFCKREKYAKFQTTKMQVLFLILIIPVFSFPCFLFTNDVFICYLSLNQVAQSNGGIP